MTQVEAERPRQLTPHRLIAVVRVLIAIYPHPATLLELKDEIVLCGHPEPRYHSLRRTVYALWRLGIVIRCPGRPARYFFCHNPARVARNE